MDLFKYDLYRYYGEYKKISLLKRFLLPNGLKYLKVFRKSQSCSKIMKKYYTYRLIKLSKKTFIQIPVSTKIGKGFYIGHDGRVIINSKTIIGDNCNIATGVTIGIENRGKRKGTPIIGNSVWIGTNAVIVGNVKIGNDVLIAPLSYVNFDVPDHSIVIGNPAKIISRENATDAYVCNKV